MHVDDAYIDDITKSDGYASPDYPVLELDDFALGGGVGSHLASHSTPLFLAIDSAAGGDL